MTGYLIRDGFCFQNFNFRLFELGELDSPITRSSTLIIKVWTKRHETWSLLLEDDVDLRALNWLGTLQNVHFPPNSLVFHMIDGIYSLELSNKYPAPTKQPAPLPTSSYNTLMRLATLDNSVQDAIATRDALAQQINELLERETKNELPAEQDRAAYANRCLAQQRRAVDAARKKNDELRASIAARKAAIAEGRALQKRAETDVENAAEKLTHSKESVARTKDQIRGQRRRICEDLSRIFSIVPVPNPSGGPPAPLSFQICGTPLPNTTYDPTALKSSDEDQLSAALGHVAQLTHNLQYYLSAPLPYQIHPYGSRSSIRDDISQLPETQREFPLYVPRGGSSAQYRFDYGWFLLNKDIEALCVSQGLKVVDIRHTLPNLKYLLYVCSAGTEELPERKRGGVRGLWAGRMRSFGIPSVDGNNDAASSLGGGSRRGSDASDATAAGKHHREELQRKAVGLPPANGVANSPTPVIKVSTEGGESVSGIGAGAGGESASASLANLNLPFGKYETKLTLRTKGLRESAAR